MEARSSAYQICDLVEKHRIFRNKCLNMIAAENITSPAVRRLVASDLMHRYGEYEDNNIEVRWDYGNKYVIEVEKIVCELAKTIFNVEHVDVRPVSGHIAILAAIGAFAKPGTTVFEVAEANGGHGWCHFANDIATVNYTPAFYPFDTDEWNIDVDAASRKIRRLKPSVMILGTSMYLFPQPVRDLRSVADEVGAILISDEAHVLGLIAGKQWPNPLVDGASVLAAGTHKSLPGPQKGIIMTNSAEYARKIAGAMYPGLLTNHHLMNVAALGYCLAEMLEFGESYAKQTVANARTLAEALSENGFDVIAEKRGFTQSHQVLIRTGKTHGSEAAMLLEKAHIIVNKMELEKANGLRIGVSELTRVGMRQSDMKEIAVFYREVLLERKDPERIAKHIQNFVSNFQEVQYTFNWEKGSSLLQ